MIVQRATARSSPEMRREHRRRITASDMRAALADRDSKAHRQLIERLVLDFEDVENHTEEFPDPWHAEHDAAVASAIARYKLDMPGNTVDAAVVFVQDELFTWLGCSPHALVGDDGCVHVRWRKTLRAFKQAGDLDRYELARVHAIMRVCGRQWCDVVDFWDGDDPSLDKIAIRHVIFDERVFLETIVPRLVVVWQTVALRRTERHRVE